MNNVKKAYYLLRYLGPKTIWLRAGVYVRNGLGITKRVYRLRPWSEIDLARITRRGTPPQAAEYAAFKLQQDVRFLFPLGQPPGVPQTLRAASADRQPSFEERVRLLYEGKPVYFLKTPSPTVVDWHVNPIDGTRGDPTRSWCEMPDFTPEQGDMRMLWEPSRAAWAIDMAKARGQNQADAADLYWEWLDSWMQASPPYLGFQWRCGQESSIRFFALAIGFWSIALDPATTPERWVQFARMAWATGHRVAHHINYAISQKNNHSMSEAVGLMLIALLFPELRHAGRWWRKGRRVLAWDIRRQVAPDGTFVQSSMNYQRVMMQVCTLGLRLAELRGQPFERDLYDRLARCSEFVYQCMEQTTGRVPNYGHNDGAYVLPLSECDFTDYRPVVQTVHFLAHRKRLFEPGPWDEELVWLFGGEALKSPQDFPREQASTAFRAGGYYTIRTPESWGMLRCHTYRDRPGQCDALHFDYWWRGQNVLLDCGSYKYYVPDRPDIEFYFRSIESHNTVEVDGKNYLESGGRFLWFPWPAAREVKFDVGGPVQVFTGEHEGYNRSPWHVVHRRTVVSLPGDQGWMVDDDLIGTGEHRAVARWHMMDVPCEVDEAEKSLRLDTPRGPLFFYFLAPPSTIRRIEIVRGRLEPGRFQGFASSYYGEMAAVPTLEFEVAGPGTLHIRTILSPRPLSPAEITALRRRLDAIVSGERRSSQNRPGPAPAPVAVSSAARDE